MFCVLALQHTYTHMHTHTCTHTHAHTHMHPLATFAALIQTLIAILASALGGTLLILAAISAIIVVICYRYVPNFLSYIHTVLQFEGPGRD